MSLCPASGIGTHPSPRTEDSNGRLRSRSAVAAGTDRGVLSCGWQRGRNGPRSACPKRRGLAG
ncbi:hypothetical protein PSMK_18290 [Phycisphaera mikurensis NBRC 102666]|uniref:Uncharacterized protein n=1 Tax=Phycisphaera mikurensis (strain NBRC 102666 / KCTC 22515 / FYK2301M01) TaxID=1142394 RepID=I0IFF0_PHYMF|nr:hypothetical protein PSMK_18290 [Phycisphaera mikurensis NBRC 102666]